MYVVNVFSERYSWLLLLFQRIGKISLTSLEQTWSSIDLNGTTLRDILPLAAGLLWRFSTM